MFWVGFPYFKHKSYFLRQMVSNSILLLQYKKIYCIVYWEWGAGFNLLCQTRSFSFLSSFHMGSQRGRDLVLKSARYNSSQPVPPCFKKHAVPLRPPAHGTELHRPYGPRTMEPPSLGWLGWWGQIDTHVGSQLSRADEASRPGVSEHTWIVWWPRLCEPLPSSASATGFYVRGAAASEFSLFSRSRAAL